MTPALSANGESNQTGRKDCDSKVEIKGWPSIAAFIVWKLAFKKAVAATSRRPKLAYAWITAVENATWFEDLTDSGDFEELDSKLSTALDSLTQCEFKRKVQVKETELAKQGLPITGRQTTWMLYDIFKVSDNDGTLLD